VVWPQAKGFWSHQKLKDLAQEPLAGWWEHGPADTLIFGLPAPRTVGEQISVVLSHQLVLCYGSHRKLTLVNEKTQT
jgi:hypothetical protein